MTILPEKTLYISKIWMLFSMFAVMLIFPHFNSVNAQTADILEVVGDKYFIKINGQEYRVLYGYGSSFEVSQKDIERDLPDLISINLNKERKSLQIQLDNVHESFLFWTMPDPELLSAEDYNYQVFVDGKQTLYDLVIQAKGARIGFVMPPGTENVEIIGTKVVPEFGSLAMVILGVSIVGIVLIVRKSTQFLPRY